MKVLEGASLARVREKDCARLDRHYVQQDNGLWTESEKAGAVAIYSVSDSPIEGKVNFLFKETMPTEGVKGLNNPSTITGVSSVKAGLIGKNLLVYPYRSTSASFDGLSAIADSEGCVVFNGTKITTGRGYISVTNGTPDGGPNGVPCDVVLTPGMQYTASLSLISGSVSNAQDVLLAIIDHDAGVYIITCGVGNSVTFTPTHKHFRARLEAASGVAFSNVSVAPQLELGSTATSFEPYEGADYTVQLGDTYYGGSLNLATGVMTVTRQYMVADNNAEINWIGTNFVAWRYPTGRNATGRAVGTEVCSHFSFSGAWDNSFAHFYATPSAGLYITNPNWTSSTWLQYFTDQYNNGTPVTACYQLADPITIQLTPVEILSLIQTDKYTPRLNTIYTDAESVQICYKKSPIREAYEQRQAIASIGGV